jgi:nucleoside-diphosphate kinase
METERTLVLVKPDGVRRGLIGEIISRFERLEMKIIAMKMMRIDEDLAARQYHEHEGEPFYDRLMSFITSGEVVVMVLEGESAISAARKEMGPTDPTEAPPGTIRGDYEGLEMPGNLVHGSDSPESAEREIGLFFPGL